MIYTVSYGDTIYSVAENYSLSPGRLISDNGLVAPYTLVPGQALLVLIPLETYTLREGDTLQAIAERYGVSINYLLQRNPTLSGVPLNSGETIVISYRGESLSYPIYSSAYAYPFIDNEKLDRTLPYLSAVIPFTYGFNRSGELIIPDDERIINYAKRYGIKSVMHFSTLSGDNRFDSSLSYAIFDSKELENTVINAILSVMDSRGYSGIDVDFEYISGDYAVKYAEFITNLRMTLSPRGYTVAVALAPKYSRDMRGLLYEGHDYSLLGRAADYLLLMTYEWGYEYSEPQAVAPINNVRRVVEYARSVIPSDKLLLGIPNYGYDWQLPYIEGQTRAKSISNIEAPALAARYGAEINYSERDSTPFFNYTDENGREHAVFFEDPRSIQAKLSLIKDYSLAGIGVWNLMRQFPAMWLQIATSYGIEQ